MHVAQKFEHLLDTYRHADGHKWTGAQLGDATGGVVTHSYVTNLRKGRIENPGYEKMRAIAKAMCFPPEVWFKERLGDGRSIGSAEESCGVAGRLEHVFEVVRNPKTGEPYTNPTAGQVSALASVFGAELSYLLDHESPLLPDEELVQALRDEDVRDITRESSRLPDRERQLMLGIVRQFRDQKKVPSG